MVCDGDCRQRLLLAIPLVLRLGLTLRYVAVAGRCRDLRAPLPAPGTAVPLMAGQRLPLLGSEHDTPFAAAVVDMIARPEIPDDYCMAGYRYRAQGTYLIVRVRVTNRGRNADNRFSRLRDVQGQLQPGVADGAITGAAGQRVHLHLRPAHDDRSHHRPARRLLWPSEWVCAPPAHSIPPCAIIPLAIARTDLSADRIPILAEGRLAASGTHDELPDTSPRYRELDESQRERGAVAHDAV